MKTKKARSIEMFTKNERVQFVGDMQRGLERSIVWYTIQGVHVGFKGIVVESNPDITLVHWDLIPGCNCQVTISSVATKDLVSLDASDEEDL